MKAVSPIIPPQVKPTDVTNLLSNLKMPSQPTKKIEVFENPAPKRDYLVHLEVPEFTCLCPLTGQPDFALIVIDYIPDRKNVELKALKTYMWSFRDEGAFHEAVTNRILDELVGALSPRFMRLTARWYVRGGIFTTVVAEHRKRGWKSSLAIAEPSFATSNSSYK